MTQRVGRCATSPRSLQRKACAAAHPGNPRPPTLSRRTNCSPDPAREPGILEAVPLPTEEGGENWQQRPEPEREVGGAGCCVFLLLWFILLNFFLSFPTYFDGHHPKLPWPVLPLGVSGGEASLPRHRLQGFRLGLV